MIKALQAKLVARLTPFLEGERLQPSRELGVFVRQPRANDSLGVEVALRTASRPGYYKLAMTGWVRVHAIEDVYVPHHPLIGDKDRRTHRTLALNCDTLTLDRYLLQSHELGVPGALDELVARASAGLANDVLPALEKLCSREGLVASFLSDDPRVWASSDRMIRGLVLMSDRALDRDRDGFERRAQDLLKFCSTEAGRLYSSAAVAVVTGIRTAWFAS